MSPIRCAPNRSPARRNTLRRPRHWDPGTSPCAPSPSYPGLIEPENPVHAIPTECLEQRDQAPLELIEVQIVAKTRTPSCTRDARLAWIKLPRVKIENG